VRRRRGRREEETAHKVPTPQPVKEEEDVPLSPDIRKNIARLKATLGGSDDIVFREFKINNASELEAALIFIDGLTNKDHLQRDLLAPLMLFANQTGQAEWASGRRGFEALKSRLLTMTEIKDASTLRECIEAVLAADAVLLIEGSERAILLGVKTWEHRPVMEPTSERIVRGPRDGFNELFKSNIALVRRRIKSPYLRVKYARVGRRTQTDIAIMFEEALADPALVTEVYRRMQFMDVDGILDSGYIEQYIEDSPYSPFPQVQHTERPDRVAAALLEGRVAILVDGTPFAIMVPATLSNFLPTPEDHYERWLLMTGVRVIRTVSLFVGILLPALYVAITTFHHEMIPRQLVLTITAARVGVPFPAMVEALVMEVTFELLREGGIRVPGPIGPTIGIVGGIIIGQAAVVAGLVSPIMVVVVAVTAIGSFAVPSFNVGLALRLLRFPLILFAGAFGLYGVMAGVIIILMHVVSLKSFGVPYLAPIAPSNSQALKDTIVRAPLWSLTHRPKPFHPREERRIGRPHFMQHKQDRGEQDEPSEDPN